MPSTVYKGDLAEVTFGHETGFQLQEGHNGISGLSHAVSGDTSVITIAATTAANFLIGAGNLLAYPRNMLVGCRVRIIGGTNWADDDYTATGRLFTIVANATNTITVTPALKDADANAGPNDIIIIDSFATPTIDISTVTTALNSAHTADERVLTDQFIGIAGTVALPETKVDIKRYHVVGVGRDVAVQAPGKFTNEGGSMELMLNSPRWLYYCLGGEIINAASKGLAIDEADAAYTAYGGANALSLATDVAMGDTHVKVNAAPNNIYFATGAGAADRVTVGDYIVIEEVIDAGADYLVPVVQHKEVDLSATPSNYFGKSGGDDHDDFYESGLRSEIRRITAIDNGQTRFYVDDPWGFPHESTATGHAVRFIRFQGAGVTAYHGPDMNVTSAAYGALTNATTRLLFSRWHIPSFALEASIRSRDTGSYNIEQSQSVPGGASDSKQLTRVFKGCKVTDWSLSADTDAALKLSVNFGAAMCYTDTGRLETTAADRFTAHRMFENTANTATARKESGIAERTQKPYFFYNGSINIGAQSLAQVTNFTLSGSTGVTYHHTIRTSTITETVTANGQSAMQIPFGGSRNASLAVEGKETFDLSMEVIVDDPIFWHQMRGAQDFTGANTAGAEIRLDFTKQGAGAGRERMTVVIDDYYIAEAPLPIPEDKGVIRSALKIVPKSVRVVSTDALLHC